MSITEEQREFQLAVREFVESEVRPVIGDHYERGEFPAELVRKLGELGVAGVMLPEEYGGAGMDLLTFCLALEEIAKVDSGLATTLEASATLGAEGIALFGTEDQKKRWLPRLASGEGLCAFGLTEPGGGTDAGHTETRAELVDGEWVINGAKCFITNSGTEMTDLIVVTATTGPGEVSTIIVPNGTPGLSVGPLYSKVGWHTSDTRPVFLDDCRVPEENLLGPRGKGLGQFLNLLARGRVAIAAIATGLAQGCVDESLAQANDREAFGKAIGNYQSIAFMLADMKLRAHTSRLAYLDAATMDLESKEFIAAAAMAKLHASDAAVQNAREGTQIFGGYGFMNETLVARHWRDCKILEIGEGTNEVQRMLIARSMGLNG
ncbi:acyl-CoA dehydrogenase family protein [Salininema proteolyticum]|uniref:Acyl-CoA dehydrogenase family protein n=1 Tax=Salininema proteolyticum TaxID=1607685 RepID=A0ABV8TVT7_9ACTN